MVAMRLGWAGLAMFHKFTVWSQLAVARICPFGEKATVRTVSVSWLKVAIRVGWAGSSTFHKVTLWSPSPVPVARIRPLGENTTAATQLGKRIVRTAVGLMLCG